MTSQLGAVEIAVLVIALIWVIGPTVGCILLAANKQRSRLLWGALGFVFGLIALGLLAVLPRDPDTA